MFEVGIKSAKEELEKIKKEFQDAQGDLSKLLKVKVSIEGIDTITKALSQIGDTTALRNLRSEVEALNKEFVILSKGAGGEGSIASRGIQQQIEQTRQSLERYNQQLKDLTEQRTKLVGGKMNKNYGNLTTDMEQTQMRIDGANSAIKRLEEQLANLGSSTRASVVPVDEAILQLKQHIDALASSRMTINLGGDFAKWTEQVQALVVQIKELVEQYKQLAKPVSAAGDNGVLKSQTEDTKKLAEAKEQLATGTKKAADAQASDEGTNKITNTYERFKKLLVDIENEMAKIGKIQAFGEQSGFSPTILKQAVEQFEKLKMVVDATINGKPIAEGLTIPMTPEQLSQFVAQFALLRSSYKDIVSEADKFNKQSERDFTAAQKSVQTEIDKTIAKLRALDEAIKRGEASGRDMSVMSDARSKLQGQLNILQKMTASDYSDSRLVEKRIKNIQQLREDTELLRKAEEKLTSAQERNNKAKDKADTKALNDEIKSVNDAWIKYNELSQKIKELRELHSRGFMASIDLTQIESAIARYVDLRNVMREIINNNGRTSRGNLTAQVWGDHNTKKSMQDAVAETKSFKQALTDVEKRMNKAGSTAENLGKYIDTLKAKRVDFKGLDTTRFDTAIQRIRDIRAELERFSQTGQSSYGVNANEIVRNMGLAAAKKEVSDATAQLNSQLRKNAQEAKEASSATSRLTSEEERLASAMKSANNTMHGQSQVLADLKTMATQYLGVWGAQQFVQNIIQIGGQLEQQRLSIGAILGDMAAGQHLFDQIKQLALTSPFGVMELDKDTKQLSAYGFKQSELFDMTKRLADISAGAGTDVSRLALALGHVRSEGALTGYTLRQFAMNNIPMLQKLSERLTKIEGQIVSTAEIRKRVSKKEIGYEDVIAVIKDLTNEGGMFFNMQETMAEAVNAKFKNLKDSMDIMYGEMAEGGIGSALKTVAESLMFLTRNWEETARVVGYCTAAFAVYRVAVSAANTQMLTYGSTLGTTTKILNAKAIALGINTAAVKRLTADEIDEMVTLKLVTREQLLNAVATKKLTVDQAELAAATFGVTRAELTSIATKGKLGVVSAGLGLRLRSLALSIRGVGIALKSMFLNPVGMAIMAITGAFEVFMRWKQRNEEIAQSIDQLGKKGSEGYKNLAATMEKYSGKDEKMSESEYSTAIGDIIDQLKNYAPNIHNIQEEAQSIDSLAERYKYLRDELESTKNAYSDLERTKSFASNANEATGNMLNDTFTENVEDYISNVQKVDKAEQELMQHRIALEKTLDELEKKSSFKRRTDENGNLLSLVEQIKYIRSTDLNKSFAQMLYSNSQGASAAFGAYSSALHKMEERMRNEVMPDLQNFASRLNNDYASTFGKNWKENADHVKTAWMAVSSEIEKVPGMTENVKRDLLEKIFNETWHMNIDFSTGEVTESLTGWRKEMQDWLDEHGLKFSIGFNDSREDIYKKAKAAQETAQTEMNNAGQVLIGIGFKLNNLPGTLPSPLATPWNQKNLEDYNEQKNVNDLWEQFQKHFGANWQTKQDKANNKTKKEDDKDARRLREIVKLYKDAYDWYVKYEKQIGEGAALTKVQGQFKPLFKEFEDQFKQRLSLDSIPKYKENLTALLAEAEKLYKSPKHKNSYMVEAIKQIRDAINNVDYEELQRKQDEFASNMTRQLDELTRKWDIFNSVKESTGDTALAERLSGITSGATVADVKRLGIDQLAGVLIDYDRVLGMSEDQIDKYAESLGLSKDQIKGVAAGLKDWKKAQEDVDRNDIVNYAKWLGSLVDIQTIRNRNQIEYNQTLKETNRLQKEGKISDAEADRRRSAARDDRDYKDWTATTMYANLYNNAQSMARGDFDEAFAAEMEHLKARLNNGRITLQQYTEQVDKLNEIASEFKADGFLGMRGGVGSFLQGGVQGLLGYYRYRANRARSNGDEDDAKKWQKRYESLDKMQKGAEMVAKVFQDLSNASNMLADMFDALGNESAANAFSDAGSVLGGIAGGAQSLSAFGPYGMAAGAVIGGITSIAQLHDKKRERQLEALKREVTKVDNTLNLIKDLRQETLGYDNGQLRRTLAAQYANNRTDSGNAMYEYYSRGGLTGNGYKQELEALKKQRELYQEMYDTENDKKKSSAEALEEYKVKMSELDITIQNFAKDIAEDLFGIDLKGWADQIGDSLMTAFENGENAAEAFNDSVRDIMRSVLNRMLSLGILEPMMENLRNKIFGKNGKGGVFDATNPEGTIDAAMKEITAFFGEGGEGQKMIMATETFYNKWQDFVKSYGLDLSENGNGSSSSGSIRNVTEQTADLLAAYINAIRADVSVNRAMIAQYFPMYLSAITSGNASLRNIENQTAAIMRSNDAIQDSNAQILSLFNGLKSKTWKVPMA